MRRQVALNLPEQEVKEPSLREIIVDVLNRFGPRKRAVLAQQLGASESHLSEVLSANGKHMPDGWLEHITKNYDYENKIAAHVAAWRGLRVAAPKPMDSAEWKRRVSFVLARHNGLGLAIIAEAMALPPEEFGGDE